MGLYDALYILQTIYFHELVHDDLYILTVMNLDLYGAVEYAIVTADGELVDIDIKLGTDYFAYIQQHPLAVYSLYLDGGIEKKLLVHIPLGIDNTIAVAGL